MKKLLISLALAISATAIAPVASAAPKPTIAVIEFKNESGAGWWGNGVGWELSGMLSNELASSRAFAVLERSKIQNVLEEQNLAASGRVSAATGARMGKLIGAQYLIAGTVTA